MARLSGEADRTFRERHYANASDMLDNRTSSGEDEASTAHGKQCVHVGERSVMRHRVQGAHSPSITFSVAAVVGACSTLPLP
eukprot:830502-Pleurochrysis_carterae.AAC.1